ncbi:CLUMA_CG014863, isoform A [Clunio marinus]|uniref:CLUMA_CG014863, isoform A n=1 Tax=Clunio marinus TaxID=568069 RepID=A0A1J1INA8_9DIPT|nr:CLUMA_CG014863, isoform A [Clunio marinus]
MSCKINAIKYKRQDASEVSSRLHNQNELNLHNISQCKVNYLNASGIPRLGKLLRTKVDSKYYEEKVSKDYSHNGMRINI